MLSLRTPEPPPTDQPHLGVEVEFVCPYDETVELLVNLSRATGSSDWVLQCNHDSFDEDDETSYDSCEVCLPLLLRKSLGRGYRPDLSPLEALLSELDDSNFSISCGMHFHLDVRQPVWTPLRKAFLVRTLYSRHDDLMALVPEDRRVEEPWNSWLCVPNGRSTDRSLAAVSNQISSAKRTTGCSTSNYQSIEVRCMGGGAPFRDVSKFVGILMDSYDVARRVRLHSRSDLRLDDPALLAVSSFAEPDHDKDYVPTPLPQPSYSLS